MSSIAFAFLLMGSLFARLPALASTRGHSSEQSSLCHQLLARRPFLDLTRATEQPDWMTHRAASLEISSFELNQLLGENFQIIESGWGTSLFEGEAHQGWMRIWENLNQSAITEEHAEGYLRAIAQGRADCPDWIHPFLCEALHFSYVNFIERGTTSAEVPDLIFRLQEASHPYAFHLSQLIYWDRDEQGSAFLPHGKWLLQYMLQLTLVENLEMNARPDPAESPKSFWSDFRQSTNASTITASRGTPFESRWLLALSPELAPLFEALRHYPPAFRNESGNNSMATFYADGFFINDPDRLSFKVPLFQTKIGPIDSDFKATLEVRTSVLWNPESQTAELRLDFFDSVNQRNHELWQSPQRQLISDYLEHKWDLFWEKYMAHREDDRSTPDLEVRNFEDPIHIGLMVHLTSTTLQEQFLFAQFLAATSYFDTE